MNVFTKISARAGCDTRSIFKGGLNSSFPARPVTMPRLKSPVCPTILHIVGGRIVEFIHFPRV